MAHFAKLDENNVVLAVHIVDNSVMLNDDNVEVEQNGIDFLTELYGHSHWRQCSYNTIGNQHTSGKVPFRGNYPAFDYVYDYVLDVFYPPRPFNSWTLDNTVYQWKAPIEMPPVTPGNPERWMWDENTLTWKAGVWDPTIGWWKLPD